jgi:hypothetical protein
MGARNYANERRAFWPGKRAVRKGFTLLGFLSLLDFLVGFVSRAGMGLGWGDRGWSIGLVGF